MKLPSICYICDRPFHNHTFKEQTKCHEEILSLRRTSMKEFQCGYCNKKIFDKYVASFCSPECRASEAEELRRVRTGHPSYDFLK